MNSTYAFIYNNNIISGNNNRYTSLNLFQYKCCYTKILEILTKTSINSLNYCIKYLAKNRPLHIIYNGDKILIQSLITGYIENFNFDIRLIIDNKIIKIPYIFNIRRIIDNKIIEIQSYIKSKLVITPNYSSSYPNKIYMTIQQNKKFSYY